MRDNKTTLVNRKLKTEKIPLLTYNVALVVIVRTEVFLFDALRAKLTFQFISVPFFF